MARQYVVGGPLGAVYINESGDRQEALSGVLLNELPTLVVTASQTLEALSQTASVAVVDVVTAAQTLEALSQTSSITVTPVSSGQTVVFLTTTGAGTWTVPTGVTSLDSVEAIGCALSGANGSAKSAGIGGFGADYAKIANYAVTPGASIAYSVGFLGTGTDGVSWFDGSTNGIDSVTAAVIASRSGGVASSGSTVVAGSANSGQTGGSAGKFGLVSWTQTSDSATAAPGAGGVGGAPATAGGLYGGGGGGGNIGGGVGGTGRQGIIVLTYTAAVATVSKDPDAGPDLPKRRYVPIEGPSALDKALADLRTRGVKALERAKEAAQGNKLPAAKREARKAAKALETVREVSGALLSDDALAELDIVIHELRTAAANWSAPNLFMEANSALMAALALEAELHDDEEAIIAFLSIH
jgi:hypothetical protein